MAIQFLNTVAVDTNVLYVDTSSDRVGIGETSPDRLLHLKSSLPAVRLEDSDVSGLYHEFFASTSGLFQFKADGGNVQANSGFMFQVDNSERMRINSSGSVGIGTTSPSAKLNVSGGNLTVDNPSSVSLRLNATSTSNPTVIVQAEQQGSVSPPMGQLRWDRNPGGVGMQLNYYNGTILNALKLDGSNFIVINNGSERMRINSSGNVGIGTTSPGQKLDVVGSIRSQFNSGDYSQIESNSSGGVIKALSSGSTTVLFRSYGDSYILNDLGIGVSSPNAKLDVNGGVRIANDTSAASASNVGTLKYYTSGNNSYVDMCMQTGATTYAWVNIVTNTW